jgi:Translation initiation factor 3 (IF-3)
MGHTEMGEEVLKDFLKLVDEYGKVEKEAKMEGRNLVVILVPKA